jgi:hypothetical protein
MAANDLFEEAEGNVTDAQPSASVAGNWGTLLRDLANATRDPAEGESIPSERGSTVGYRCEGIT